MNHHRLSRPLFVCLLLVVCGLSAASHAQLPPAAFAAPTPTVIDSFVKLQVDRLVSADPAAWATARNLLITEGSHREATPAFLAMYAGSINDHLIPLAKNGDARIRLNAAIVAARVAAKANTADLAPVTQAFLKDSSDAVVLWGLQTAKYVIPALLTSGVADDAKTADIIAKEAVQAAKDHVSPAIMEEAYRTLLLNPNLPGQSPVNYLNSINSLALQTFLANPLSLYQYRIKLYDGVEVPQQAVADTWAAQFLTQAKVWGSETPAQQSQTLNLTLALLQGAAKQNAAAASPEMIDTIKRTGQAFEVVANNIKNPSLRVAAHAVSVITTNDAPPAIDAAVMSLDTAVAGLGLPPPPAP